MNMQKQNTPHSERLPNMFYLLFFEMKLTLTLMRRANVNFTSIQSGSVNQSKLEQEKVRIFKQ